MYETIIYIIKGKFQNFIYYNEGSYEQCCATVWHWQCNSLLLILIFFNQGTVGFYFYYSVFHFVKCLSMS